MNAVLSVCLIINLLQCGKFLLQRNFLQKASEPDNLCFMFQSLQPARDRVKLSRSVCAIRGLDRTVGVAPLIEGALGNVQFLTQGFDGLAFFVSAECFDFEFRWIIRWHRINPFVNNEPIILQNCQCLSKKSFSTSQIKCAILNQE